MAARAERRAGASPDTRTARRCARTRARWRCRRDIASSVIPCGHGPRRTPRCAARGCRCGRPRAVAVPARRFLSRAYASVSARRGKSRTFPSKRRTIHRGPRAHRLVELCHGRDAPERLELQLQFGEYRSGPAPGLRAEVSPARGEVVEEVVVRRAGEVLSGDVERPRRSAEARADQRVISPRDVGRTVPGLRAGGADSSMRSETALRRSFDRLRSIGHDRRGRDHSLRNGLRALAHRGGASISRASGSLNWNARTAIRTAVSSGIAPSA